MKDSRPRLSLGVVVIYNPIKSRCRHSMLSPNPETKGDLAAGLAANESNAPWPCAKAGKDRIRLYAVGRVAITVRSTWTTCWLSSAVRTAIRKCPRVWISCPAPEMTAPTSRPRKLEHSRAKTPRRASSSWSWVEVHAVSTKLTSTQLGSGGALAGRSDEGQTGLILGTSQRALQSQLAWLPMSSSVR